jgi:hypothetical protein
MLGKIRKLRTLLTLVANASNQVGELEKEINGLKLLCGSIHANINRNNAALDINAFEFTVFSKFGDDGIIQYLVNKIEIANKTFIEFGVEDFFESNTRFLMMKDNWEGFVLDGAKENIDRLTKSNFYWKYQLKAADAFITKANINELLEMSGFDHDLGLLHIDLDGNDYWIWKQIEKFSPRIVILEYNSVFGNKNSWTIPYKPDFRRFNSHYSGLYWGASLPALFELSDSKGYDLVGCNLAGNNAYFVRRDVNALPKLDLMNGFKVSKYRESRDKEGNLTFISKDERLQLLEGLQIFNTITQELETITSE